MPNLSSDILTFILIATNFTLLVLLIKQRRNSQNNSPFSQTSIPDTDQKSLHILHRAYLKAKDMLGSAELNSLKMVADNRVQQRKMESLYEKEMENYLTAAKDSINKQLADSQASYTQFLNTLQDQGTSALNLNQEYIKRRTDQLFEKFEENLSTFLTSAQGKSVEAINLEIKAGRQLIDTYKSQQLTIIDENIVSMLEQTLSLVMTKKISLKDEMDLIYEALDKAKAENFII